jgi:hypothetical protein
MQDPRMKQSYMAEAAKFNANASKLLLARSPDAIIELFAKLGYECSRKGESYRLPCPVCGQSFAWIGTAKPIAYPIYWGCYSPDCPSKTTTKWVKNLLGLVRACVEGQSLSSAYKAIADFLGFARSFDITNLVATPEPQPVAVPPPAAMPHLPERHPDTLVRPRMPTGKPRRLI